MLHSKVIFKKYGKCRRHWTSSSVGMNGYFNYCDYSTPILQRRPKCFNQLYCCYYLKIAWNYELSSAWSFNKICNGIINYFWFPPLSLINNVLTRSIDKSYLRYQGYQVCLNTTSRKTFGLTCNWSINHFYFFFSALCKGNTFDLKLLA